MRNIFNYLNISVKRKSFKGWYIPAMALTALLCGCSIFSGSRPIAVTATDRELVEVTYKKPESSVPLITHPLDGRSVKIYKVAFDGTMNDATRVSVDERPTVVAHIAKRIEARYYPGPGMQNEYFRNWLDGLVGYTSTSIAQHAKREFFVQASAWLAADPNVEIRIFVVGFSRGAAIARHFMNIVEQDWPKSSAGVVAPDGTPHFYAMLYDTVSTGQMDTLQLSLPASLDYLIHMVAKDEPRSLFVPVIDRDDHDTTAPSNSGITNPFNVHRINLLILPGAHSDIGAAYEVGVGDNYRDISEQFLYKMGLLSQNCWESFDDPFTQGKHDSRGIFDLLSGRSAPNSDHSVTRSYYIKDAQLRSDVRDADIASRLYALSLANMERGSGTARIRSHIEDNLVLKLKRQDQGVTILEYAPSSIDASSFKFSITDGVRRLNYRFLAPYNEHGSSLVLSDAIWKRLPEGQTAKLSYGSLQTGDKTYLAIHVNDILVSSDEATVSPSSQIQTEGYRCKRDAEGNAISPINIYILRPPQAE
ncbi:hypothetical protein CFter6_0468 [Collimonas fungivorans]|uniref:Uncharacterized protein n=1 Tax=Collimonas fungivorans TaxID=158899 RepID=A0A127P5U4_9BURK|nr:DUF2235 domain-containing protein [Collimonas fungivorans]AMO93199.1 hypothetical protein CFter6_0468 [Collimonas fungivorans]